MSKKQLYILIVLLSAVVLYLLFAPFEELAAPTPEVVPETVTSATSTAVVEEANPAGTEVESVTIEGLFLSLAEEKTEFQKSFYYLMLDDGTEVVRIDLRPILGYSVIDPISKLGVDRGVRVIVTGTLTDSGFEIATIAPAAE